VRNLLHATVALFCIVTFVICTFLVQGRFSATFNNVRTERLERLGYEAVILSGATTDRNNAVQFEDRGAGASTYGAWDLDSYEIDHELADASTCDVKLYFVGANARGLSADARADVSLDGNHIRTIAFGKPTIDYVVGANELAPSNVTPSEIYLTPINRQFGLLFDAGSSYCKQTRAWRVGLALHHVGWNVQRVGAIVSYAPIRPSIASAATSIAIAAIVLIALVLAQHVLLTFVRRAYGSTALVVVVAIACLACLTHDEWDYAVWLRFIDLAAFGRGDPAFMWAGSPLWPFVPSALFGPILVASYALTGNASYEIPSLFLKLFMALALTANAYAISRCTVAKWQRFVFFTTLLAPVGLYEVGGGYREIFAASFAIAGLIATLRSKYVVASVLMALGTSISESLAPLLLFPMAVALTDRRPGFASRAISSGIVAIGVLGFEWFALIPHRFAANAVVTRVQAYRYGGASIFAVLDHYGLLPNWIASHSLALVAGLFTVLAAPIAALLVAAIARAPGTHEQNFATVLRYFIALVVALFLAYRGIDPNDWYPLFVMLAFYFVRFEPQNPFALLVGVLPGIAFYTILGIGDFVNWSYFFPVDRGLLGTLGASTFVMIGTVNLTLIAFYIATIVGDTRILFSRGTAFYLAIFVAAMATAASHEYPIDIVFCATSIVAIGIAFHRLLRTYSASLPSRGYSTIRFIGLATIAVAAAFAASGFNAAGAGGAAAAIAAFAAVLYGTRYGYGLCDIVLATCSLWILGAQDRFGWVSISGWIGLTILLIGGLVVASGIGIDRDRDREIVT
jgi:hypothetical protein